MAQNDIQGQVVDASGNPISGAIVELTRSYQSSPTTEETVVRTTTDANGNYIFESHPDSDGTTLEYHVSCYNYDGTAYVNSENNPGVTADLSASAIPDSAIAQWDATQLSLADGETVSTWPDSVNANDLTASGAPSYQTNIQNGKPVVRGDGANDFLDVDISDISAPLTFALVIATADQSSDFRAMYRSDGADASTGLVWKSENDYWRFVVNGESTDGGPTAPPVILVGYQQSSGDVVLRENGSETARNDEPLGQADSIELFGRDGGAELMDGDIAETLVYDSDLEADGTLAAEEQRLSDKWGITI